MGNKGVYCSAWMLGLVALAAPAMAGGKKLKCIQGWKPTAVNRAVGVETIHRDRGESITIFVAMPTSSEGRIYDLNAMKFGESFPQRFILTDGSLSAAFVSVDTRPNSRLNACLDEMEADLESQIESGTDPLEALVHFLDAYMDPVEKTYRHPWENEKPLALPPEFLEADSLPIGHYPLETNLRLPMVPLESFLWDRRGVCMQRVMFTSLLLNRLGLRHKLRAGGSGGGAGHIWVELPDGRHLDPTWHLLEKPRSNGIRDGRFEIGISELFRDEVYPFTVDAPYLD
jgi:hypothetical protein